MDELRVIDVDGDHATGTWGEFLLIIWRYKTEHLAVQHARQAIRDLGRERPTGIGLIAVVEQTALPPETDVRRELSSMLASGGTTIKSSSVVHEGSGFKAATVRGVVTAMSMFEKFQFPHVVHANLGETAEWHLRTMGKSVQRVRGLCDAIEELRAKLDQRSPKR